MSLKENIVLKTVIDLEKYHFKIPYYQRGYRWKEEQVLDLLNDILEFSTNPASDSFYYLQPLVIAKELHEDQPLEIPNELHENQSFRFVVDGQQRLTTILLIITELNKHYTPEHQKKHFTLHYDRDENRAIDRYFSEKAAKTIQVWLADHKADTFYFEQALLYRTRFIWYELDTDLTNVELFLRLNSGKIPLTREERIKAFFLRSLEQQDNIANQQHIIAKQQLIAYEWTLIENTFQDDAVWGFLNCKENYGNRIGLLFDLATPDNTITYDYFRSNLIGDLGKTSDKDHPMVWLWEKVMNCYEQLLSWYKNPELYHYIGYVLAGEKAICSPKELLIMSEQKGKGDFKKFLTDKIKDHMNITKDEVKESNIYEEKTHGDIVRLLLLFNILSIVQSENADERFDFSKYNKEGQKWEVEHIRSQADSNEEQDYVKIAGYILEYFLGTNKKDYVPESIVNLQEEASFKSLISEALNVWQNHSKKGFDNKPFEQAIAANKEFLNKDANTHGMGNLALLNAEINRSYKDAFFAFKRKRIVEDAKKGVFIPLCTRLVFQKAYSNHPKNLLVWTKEDAFDYENVILRVVNRYLK